MIGAILFANYFGIVITIVLYTITIIELIRWFLSPTQYYNLSIYECRYSNAAINCSNSYNVISDSEDSEDYKGPTDPCNNPVFECTLYI